MNLPNKLTIFRIMLALPLIVFLSLSLAYNDQNITYLGLTQKTIYLICGGVVFLVAMISDWWDGWWARRYRQITRFGQVFDPVADKIITNITFIFFALLRVTPFFVPIIFIFRDILVDGSRNLAVKNNKSVSANIWGKWKTAIQTIAILIIFFVTPILQVTKESQYSLLGAIFSASWQLWSMNLTTFIALFLSIVSGVIYLKLNLKNQKVFEYVEKK